MNGSVLARRLRITAMVGGFGLIFANTAFAAHFIGRAFPGTEVGGLKIGGMTREQARAALKQEAASYRIDLVVDGQELQLDPKSLGAKYDLDATLESAFAPNSQPVAAWAAAERAKEPALVMAYSVHESALKEFTSKLAVNQATAPVDAVLLIENGQPKVQPDKPGLGINKDEAEDLLRAAIANREEDLEIKKGAVPADIREEHVAPAVEEAKQILAARIVLKYEGKSFTPSAAAIGEWLVFNKDTAARKLTPSVNYEALKAYLKNVVAKQVDVAPVAKKITVVNGEVKNEEGGADGLAVDVEKAAASVSSALLTSKALTLDLPTYVVKFKTQYNRTVTLDYGRYIEVNLSAQRLWAYEDGKVVFEAPVTTGMNGRSTVEGLFSIYSKERNRYLNGYSIGYSYNVFVKYWMPFYGNYGLHDASWRGSFGGPDYTYNGSSGCVNMPEYAAAWIWDWAAVGTPVWTHR